MVRVFFSLWVTAGIRCGKENLKVSQGGFKTCKCLACQWGGTSGDQEA